MVPKPSIWAPSWILTASLALSAVGASSASVERGVYGVTYELGETVVGCEMPLKEDFQQGLHMPVIFWLTLSDLLSLVYFRYLLR